MRVDGIECLAKIAGDQLPEDLPDYFEAFIHRDAIKKEYEGLKAATGLTPRLIGEIVAEGQSVGALRQLIERTPPRQCDSRGDNLARGCAPSSD